jgi:hypothetical protein
MKKQTTIGICLIFAALSTMLGGCSTTKQARDMELKSVMVDTTLLTEGKDDQALYRYQNPKTSLKSYTQVMIMPVKFFKPAEASPEELADLQKLVNNFNQYLYTELIKDYRITNDPGPNTLKIETVIMDASKSRPGMDFLSTLVPVGMAVSIVKNFATGKPTSVGEITGELKMTDAMTGELVGAAMDRRVGGKSLSGVFTSWNDADKAMEFWAKKVRYFLCTERGGKNCEKPE